MLSVDAILHGEEVVEGENIWNTSSPNMSLTCYEEEGLSTKSFQIFPNQSLYIPLVGIRSGV